jgi:hypothetical protein
VAKSFVIKERLPPFSMPAAFTAGYVGNSGMILVGQGKGLADACVSEITSALPVRGPLSELVKVLDT